MSAVKEFKKWCAERQGHPQQIKSALEAIEEQEAQIKKLCETLDKVTTEVSKTGTLNAIGCMCIDDFLEKEFGFYTNKNSK